MSSAAALEMPPAGGGLDVALLAPCFWPEVRRGGERMARDLADGLIARGHRVRLITSHPGRRSETVEEGLAVVRVHRPREDWLARRLLERHLTHLPASYMALSRARSDVAHAFFHTDALVAAHWTRRRGRPSVFTFLGIPSEEWFAGARLRRRAMERACAGCSAVVALSEAAADGFRRLLGVEARVIPPGVDLDRFAPAAERAARPTIFCPAALDDPMKRPGDLLAAFERVRAARPDARLVVDRPRDPALAARLAAAGAEVADIAADPEALPRLYSEAWACALASRGEAFGLVLLEALACGTPAVGSDDGGIPEVLGDGAGGTGRTFAPGDPEDLARALLEAFEVAADPNARAACRERARRFSRERTAAAYERLYLELAGA